MLQTLRKAGGSLVMTVPKAFIEQNGLCEGSQVELELNGATLTIAAHTRRKIKLAALMKEMDGEALPMVKGWDDSPNIGLENNP